MSDNEMCDAALARYCRSPRRPPLLPMAQVLVGTAFALRHSDGKRMDGPLHARLGKAAAPRTHGFCPFMGDSAMFTPAKRLTLAALVGGALFAGSTAHAQMSSARPGFLFRPTPTA